MAGGASGRPCSPCWPTGESAGWGSRARSNCDRRELEASPTPGAGRGLRAIVARAYEHGQALNVATYFEIDEVIDPALTRRHVTAALQAAPPVVARQGKKRPMVDTW